MSDTGDGFNLKLCGRMDKRDADRQFDRSIALHGHYSRQKLRVDKAITVPKAVMASTSISLSGYSYQSTLSLLRERIFSGSGVASFCGPLISTTRMSRPMRNFFPLHITVVPPRQAQDQIGRARNSRPSQAAIHSPMCLLDCPAGGFAKEGVSSSSSIDAPEWSLA
jgi:hypothetical protein